MIKDKKLIIIGAGSLGVMTLDAALNEGKYSLENITFIDDGRMPHEQVHGFTIIGGIDKIEQLDKDECEFVIAIANNMVRKKIAETYDVNYVNVIHPAAVISRLAEVGTGNIILPNVTVDPETIIHNHVVVNKNVSLGHNVTMKSYSQASPGCQLGGVVGEGTFIGLGASVLPNVPVGAFATIGAGAVVTKAVPDSCTAIGIPAKVIKKL